MTAAPLPVSAAERARPHLLADVARIRDLLTAHAGEQVASSARPRGPAPLDLVTDRLKLSPFERDVLMLAVAVELDGEVAQLVADLNGSGDPRPTFALAMAALPDPHWDALVPGRPLRRWGLLDLGLGPTLAARPLQVDERVVHLVTGLGDATGPGGIPVLEPQETPLTPTQERVVAELVPAVRSLGHSVLVRLDGDDADARLGVAHRLAEGLGLDALVLADERLPEGPELTRVALEVDREARLHDVVPVTATARFAALLTAPVVVLLGDAHAGAGRTVLARTVRLPEPAEQLMLWQQALPTRVPSEVALAAGELAQHYRLGARSVAAVAAEWAALRGDDDELRRLTRQRARVSLGVLAERLEPRATWDDLVLPEGQLALLHDMASQVRHRARVYEEWGFAATSNWGFGVTALFAGDSGTGKTMAAEVIAADLRLDLFRIDLSAVVSKYIGETEKNLRRLFDAAEQGGAVLLFDEADALFGKRSDVKDSHDRYANLEVAYLLQRMEAYRGLAILTTNLRSNVDRAFLRRLRFVVQFPFPDEGLRARIWARAFPPDTPTAGLDPAALARMQVSGGSIRAIALGAAFAAAEAGAPVGVRHIVHAAKVEYAKADRTLTDAEIRALVIGAPGGAA
jgi:vesicle-fusing ATPase